MELKNFNIMNKNGVKNRILHSNENLSKLMLVSLKYQKKPFHIVDDNERYIGTISIDLITDLSYEFISKDPTLLEVLKEFKINLAVYINSPQINQNILQSVAKLFETSIENEVLLVDKNTNLIKAITNNLIFSALFIKPQYDKPYFKFGKSCGSYGIYLNKFNNSVNTQNGEDGIFEHILEVIGTTSKYAVEFGGWDGIHLSNIRELIVNKGFSGLFIEGDSTKANDCRNNYKDYDNVTTYEGYVGFEGDNTLDKILNRVNAPKEIDLMSIDIDGYDYHVWDALKEYKPRIIIIEINHTIDNDIIYINPKTDCDFKGSSAAAMVNLGASKGYSLVFVTSTNCIFVVDEEFEKFGLLDNSLEYLRKNTYLTDNKFFQTYDKELRYTSHCNCYVWDNKTLYPSDKLTFVE